ncbi:MAG: FAD-dependent oxidoreductase [Defluviimonas sp.]|uniref:FAD-dependent oxidoreductase n=1 Tax=Albidovulum sp. TaxID=1872424 RepID=UPI002A2C5BCD|nr:FAD-dependent oxidoreductase [Defluviimonas sp.]
MPHSATRAVVVGAGIIGLATACRLAESGYEVTVIERNGRPGAGSSQGNGGQLLFDRISAMGSPAFLRALPQSLLDPAQGIRLRGLAHPSRWPWAVRFLGQSSRARWQRNTESMLALAHLSREAFDAFRTRHEIAFDWRRPGKLVTYATPKGLEAAARAAAFQGQFGGRHEIVPPEACFDLEPALARTTRPIAGAVYLPDAEVGDCHLCCRELARILQVKLGGTILFNTAVTGLEGANGRIAGLRCGDHVIGGDVFVITAGMAAGALLPRRFAGRKPMVGVLGLSLTYPVGPNPPDLSVTDAGGRFVIARLGNRLRVAGGAMFSDNLSIDAGEVRTLRSKAEALMPQAARFQDDPETWIGARPQTPDDLPMIGRATGANLFVNAGHGSLGWTLAFGSAERLLHAVSEGS